MLRSRLLNNLNKYPSPKNISRKLISLTNQNAITIDPINKPISIQTPYIWSGPKSDYKTPTLIDTINKDQGLRKYMKDIYLKSGLGFGTSLAVGSMIPFMGLDPKIAMAGWIGNIGLSFYSIYKMASLETQTISKEGGYYEVENPNKEFWYKVFSISNGITIAPLIAVGMSTSPTIIPLALGATLGTFGTATWVALKQTNTNMVAYQAPLLSCVGGLIVSGLIQLGSLSLGYNNFASNLDMITTGASTLIFTGLIAVDTQKAIEDYSKRTLDSVKVAVELLLDATNLFIDIVKILIKLNEKKD